MKLSYPQVVGHLKNQLLPMYLITGNEPLLIEETRDALRQKAKQMGFIENQRYEVTKDFDWDRFIEASNTLSLFSEKLCLELRLLCKLTAPAAKLLTHFLENLPDDIKVLFIADKLDAATQKNNWYHVFNRIGGIITIWPIDGPYYLQWLSERLKQQQLRLSPASLQFMAEQTEGNLLASAQEIAKLGLLFPSGGLIPHDDVVNAITDNARYDLFTLIDTIHQGDSLRIVRVLSNLRAEGTEPTLVLWGLTREIRLLIELKRALAKNIPWSDIARTHRIWEKRQALVKQSLLNHSINSLHQLLLDSQQIDCMIKGVTPGSYWDELENLALRLGITNISLPISLIRRS
jgi:DNA polymerase III subunit delta